MTWPAVSGWMPGAQSGQCHFPGRPTALHSHSPSSAFLVTHVRLGHCQEGGLALWFNRSSLLLCQGNPHPQTLSVTIAPHSPHPPRCRPACSPPRPPPPLAAGPAHSHWAEDPPGHKAELAVGMDNMLAKV